jgi:hypothetical protein
MHLPDNVNKTIAEFLSVNTIKTDIVIYQYTGCKKNTHFYNNNCNLTYNILTQALYRNIIVKELEIYNFNISNRNYEYTINSWYYKINGSKTVKNKLRVINKIYEKYTHSKKIEIKNLL